MPIYEYKCESCEDIIERYFKVSGMSPTIICELCGGNCNKIISRIGQINMNPGGLSGVDDTDELTLGKIVAEGGMPAEHKRQYAEYRERQKQVAEYEKDLKKREEKYGFTAEEIKKH